MAVFRVEKNANYTVMSNYHLRDKTLPLKAKGLLSIMLSLPEEWDYTLKGLATLSADGLDSVRSSIVALENAGYVVRRQTCDQRGRFSGNEYHVFEYPQTEPPSSALPLSGNPTTENPITEKPLPEKPTQLNKDRTNKDKINTDGSSTDSFPSFREEGNRRDATMQDMELYREIIRENIEYDILLHDLPHDRDLLEELLELIVETVCATKKTIRVSGNDFPSEIVRSRLLKLNSEHIRFVLDCMKENTTKVRNIKQYLLATLFNAPTTMEHYYTALVNHDLYGDKN